MYYNYYLLVVCNVCIGHITDVYINWVGTTIKDIDIFNRGWYITLWVGTTDI